VTLVMIRRLWLSMVRLLGLTLRLMRGLGRQAAGFQSAFLRALGQPPQVLRRNARLDAVDYQPEALM
jgi:hypothetical protein